MLDEIVRPRPPRTLVATARLTDRERIVRILDRAGGYDVVAETGDGSTAVRLAGEVEPELVLLDQQLPVVDGIDATPAVLHRAPGAVVILLTSGGSDAGGLLAVRHGARAHVPLDSPAEVLLAALGAALPRGVVRAATPEPATAAPPPWWEAMLAES
jgi:two-component system, NarL family, nitrate/nitrite response regulator NarL